MISASLAFRDQQHISARPGIGGTRWRLSLTCNAHPDPGSAAPYILYGEVNLELPNQSHYLTSCRSDRPFWFLNGAACLDVSIDVTADQIEEIEDLRQGTAVTLRLDFTAVALSGGDADTSVLNGHQANLWVPASRWADLLTEARVAERLVLVVPAPPATADKRVHAAWQAWQTAQQAVEGGQWRNAVAACRDVVEFLGVTHEPKTPDPTERDMDERLQSVGAAIWRMTCAAKHADGTTIEIEWTRNHAVAATAATGGLLKAMLPPARP